MTRTLFLIGGFLLFSTYALAVNLVVDSPLSNAQLNTHNVVFQGKMSGGQNLLVNGEPVTVKANGQFSHALRLPLGANAVRFLAQDFVSRTQVFDVRTVYVLPNYSGLPSLMRPSVEAFVATFYSGMYLAQVPFVPTQLLTRDKMAFLAALALQVEPTSTKPEFAATDFSADQWGYPLVSEMLKRGFFRSPKPGKFIPAGLVTRQEACEQILALTKIHRGAANFIQVAASANFVSATLITKPNEPVTVGEWMAMLSAIPQVNRTISANVRMSVPVAALPEVPEPVSSVAVSDIKPVWSKVSPSTMDVTSTASILLEVKLSKNAKAVIEVDLAGIGRLSNLVLNDDGNWGDVRAGDGVYTGMARLMPGLSTGTKNIGVVVTDGQNRQSVSVIDLYLITSSPNAILPIVVKVATDNMSDEPSEQSLDYIVYDVVAGDSISKIALQFTRDVHNWEEIAQFNQLKIDTVISPKGEPVKDCPIQVGDTIKIPKRLIPGTSQ